MRSADSSDGQKRPCSIAIVVCRATPIRFARSCWVSSPLWKRNSLTWSRCQVYVISQLWSCAGRVGRHRQVLYGPPTGHTGWGGLHGGKEMVMLEAVMAFAVVMIVMSTIVSGVVEFI